MRTWAVNSEASFAGSFLESDATKPRFSSFTLTFFTLKPTLSPGPASGSDSWCISTDFTCGCMMLCHMPHENIHCALSTCSDMQGSILQQQIFNVSDVSGVHMPTWDTMFWRRIYMRQDEMEQQQSQPQPIRQPLLLRAHLSGQLAGREGDDHTGLQDAGLDTAHRHCADAADLVHVLQGGQTGQPISGRHPNRNSGTASSARPVLEQHVAMRTTGGQHSSRPQPQA